MTRLQLLNPPVRISKGLLAALRSGAWSAWKVLSSSQNLPGRLRETSFPFISGDTFRAIGDVIFDTGTTAPFTQSVPALSRSPIVFVEVGFLSNSDNRSSFLRWLRDLPDSQMRPQVIISNGDKIPSDEYLSELVGACDRVFSVNIGDHLAGVIPIPLGIENQTKKRFGFLDDYLLFHESTKKGRRPEIDRNQMFLFSFSLKTNRKERGEAILEAQRWQKFSRLRLSSSSSFRRALMRHRFVVCPEGNGKDTHRIWEALYLGAVPIIKKGSVAGSISRGLPIWEVNSWSDCFSMTEDELIAEFDKLTRYPREKALFKYWLDLIFGK